MPESKTTWSLLIGLALLVGLLVLGVVPRLRQSAELVAASTAPDTGVPSVGVAPPKRADGPIDLVLPSNIQAIEETAIYARTSGYVRERYVFAVLQNGNPLPYWWARVAQDRFATVLATP